MRTQRSIVPAPAPRNLEIFDVSKPKREIRKLTHVIKSSYDSELVRTLFVYATNIAISKEVHDIRHEDQHTFTVARCDLASLFGFWRSRLLSCVVRTSLSS